MKRIGFSVSQIEVLLGVIATALIVISIPIYAFSEPARLDSARAGQLERDLNEAMTLYAENCAVCHGLSGEGIGATPPLDNPDLQGMDPGALTKIIERGLYGTSMPAWHLEDGGPLNDYQISQLLNLIQFGDWQETQDRVVNLGLAPQVPFTTQPDQGILEEVKALPNGEILAAGITLYAQQCVACHGADGLGTSLAPALNDPAVQSKSYEELERTIRLGVPGSLMAGWEKSLDDTQIAAVLALITDWSMVPAGAIPAPDRPIPVTEESLTMGANLFATSCSRCHGPEGQGSQRAPALNEIGFLTSTTDLAIQQIITLGVPGTSMPAWGDRLTDSEIQAVVGFMRSWEPTAPAVAEPARVQGPWWQGSAAMPAGQAGQAQPGNQNAPWSQNTSTSRFQNLDWRTAGLVSVITGLSVAMILIAIIKLRRLAQNKEITNLP
jgi:mono/diheme cytochrome c family protein